MINGSSRSSLASGITLFMLVCYHICINSFLLSQSMSSKDFKDGDILLSCYFHIKVFTIISIAVYFKKLMTILYQEVSVLSNSQQEKNKHAQE